MISANFKYIVLVHWLLILVHATSASNVKCSNKLFVVVIDAGHGGKDLGASIKNVHEKNIVLNIALNLGELIRKEFANVNVVYTRIDDTFIPLYQRAELANSVKAHLFISIHVNTVDIEWIQGTETYVWGLSEDNIEVVEKENAAILLENGKISNYQNMPNDGDTMLEINRSTQKELQEKSITMASYIQKEFRTYANRVDRNVKMADLLVLRQITMPGVLIETGFLSHPNEQDFLVSSLGQATLAKSIFNAFCTYKNTIESKNEYMHTPQSVAHKNLENDVTEQEKQATKAQPDNNTKNNSASDLSSKPSDKVYFAVQIMALKKDLEPSPENFKGEKNIYQIKSSDFNRYFSGKFKTLKEANREKERIQNIYKNAFVVALENNTLISIKKALELR